MLKWWILVRNWRRHQVVGEEFRTETRLILSGWRLKKSEHRLVDWILKNLPDDRLRPTAASLSALHCVRFRIRGSNITFALCCRSQNPKESSKNKEKWRKGPSDWVTARHRQIPYGRLRQRREWKTKNQIEKINRKDINWLAQRKRLSDEHFTLTSFVKRRQWFQFLEFTVAVANDEVSGF